MHSTVTFCAYHFSTTEGAYILPTTHSNRTTCSTSVQPIADLMCVCVCVCVCREKELSDESENSVQPIAFGESFLQSQVSINDLVLYVSFAMFRCKETNSIEIGGFD